MLIIFSLFSSFSTNIIQDMFWIMPSFMSSSVDKCTGTLVLQEIVDYFEQVVLGMFAADYFCDLVEALTQGYFDVSVFVCQQFLVRAHHFWPFVGTSHTDHSWKIIRTTISNLVLVPQSYYLFLTHLQISSNQFLINFQPLQQVYKLTQVQISRQFHPLVLIFQKFQHQCCQFVLSFFLRCELADGYYYIGTGFSDTPVNPIPSFLIIKWQDFIHKKMRGD